MNYADTMNKAEMLIKLAEVERRGREWGRRESDHKLQALTGYLDLAIKLLAESIKIIESGTFEEYQKTSLKLGLSMLEGFNNDDSNTDRVRGGCRPGCDGAGCGKG